jgi:hypothetical protein
VTQLLAEATTPRPQPAATPPPQSSGGRREPKLFLVGIAVIALHVIDDNYISPLPGTSAGDHLVSGLLPLALLGLAAWTYPRLSGGRRGALALVFGVLGIAAGIEAVDYTRKVGASGDDFTGLLTIPAGLLLLGLGVVTLWRTRRTEGNRAWRYTRRLLFGAAGVVAVYALVLPIGLGTSPRTSGAPWSPRTSSASHTRTSASRPATGSSSRVGTCRRRTARP